VDDALRLSGRSGGVEDEERILGLHNLGLAFCGKRLAQRRIIDVAPFLHRHIIAGAGDDDDRLDRLHVEGLVDVDLERDDLAAAHAFVGGDDSLGAAIGDAASEALRREAPEADRMHRANTRASKHRRRRLRDHRHVDHHPVAAADAVAFEQVREAAGLFVDLLVGEGAAIPRLVGFEDQSRLVASGRQLPIEAVDTEVDLPVRIPFDVEIGLVVRPVAGPRREAVPVEPLRDLQPEGVRVRFGLPVELVDVGAAVSRLVGLGDGVGVAHLPIVSMSMTKR
jgi:hypothetical protein